jgi:hypothetical protein
MYDSLELVWSRDVLAHRFRKGQLEACLQVLVGRTLSPDEVLCCFASEKRGKPPAGKILEIQTDMNFQNRTCVTRCGENPYVVVSSVEY